MRAEDVREVLRCEARERRADLSADALDVDRVHLDVLASGDREHGAPDRGEVECRVVRHVLAEPPRRKSAHDVHGVVVALEDRLTNLRLPPQEPPCEEPLEPAQRGRDPLGLPAHHLRARAVRRTEQYRSGDPLVPSRQPDRDRRAHRMPDDRHAGGLDPHLPT